MCVCICVCVCVCVCACVCVCVCVCVVCSVFIGTISKPEPGSPADPGVPVWLIEGLRWEACRASRA